eukprot:11845647-Heterocapsa_arctica.AAC.1
MLHENDGDNMVASRNEVFSVYETTSLRDYGDYEDLFNIYFTHVSGLTRRFRCSSTTTRSQPRRFRRSSTTTGYSCSTRHTSGGCA